MLRIRYICDDVQDIAEADHLSVSKTFTLQHVLEEANLLDYVPKANEGEHKLFQRMRSLAGPMKNFTAAVRVYEGILTRASVLGPRRPSNAHNVLEHELALARAAFQCSSERQGRHAVWQTYSERVLADMVEDPQIQLQGAQPLKYLGPPTAVNEDGHRKVQLIVTRPLHAAAGACGGLRFGVLMAVWRCGRSNTENSTDKRQKLVPSGVVPVHVVSKVHVLMLMPASKDDGAGEYLVGSSFGLTS
jgi:hypothetical protein